MKVTKDTVTISGLDDGECTVQLKDADPNELQLFIEKMPASIKGESVKYNFSKLCLVLVLEWKGTLLNLSHMCGNRQIKVNMVRLVLVILVLVFKYEEE